MKVLLTLSRPLFPADTGGRIRSLNIFSRLAQRMEIHCVSLAHRERDAEAIAKMREVFRAYTPVFWQETRKFTPKFYLEFLQSRFGSLPYFLAKYNRREFREAVARITAQEHFDLMLCDFLHPAVAMREIAVRPRVVFQHNVEYVIRQRHWETEQQPLRKWLLRGEWVKARAAEAEVCRAFNHVITVSDDDSATLAREFGVRHASSIPTGVDANYFSPQPVMPREGNLVFVGSMDWHPNEDGISWFAREVYPLIRRERPQATLTVVGRNPSPDLRDLAAAESSIEITGTVPDVRPYVAQAEVVIVPLRIGGGTRIKIFEAMAMQRAVVSTTIGAEGLPVENGREILLADQPADFAGAVTALLNDRQRREAIAGAARSKVMREHTWERVAEKMEEILVNVARNVPAITPHTAAVAGAVLAQQDNA